MTCFLFRLEARGDVGTVSLLTCLREGFEEPPLFLF